MKLTAKQKGIALMVLSAFSFSLMQICVRVSGKRIPLFEQLFFRNSISLLLCGFLAARAKLPLFGARRDQFWLLGRSLFGYLGLILTFYASAKAASQADVSILTQMSPFVTTLFAVVFLKETLSKVQLPALLIASAGAFLVVNPRFESNWVPLAMALLSCFASGSAYTLLSFLKGRVPALSIIVYFSTFSAVVSLPFMIAEFVVPTPLELVLLLLIGAGGSFGQIAITYAYRFAPAAEVSIFNFTGILFTVLFSTLLLGEQIKPNSIAGALLVLAASLLVYWHGNQKPPSPPSQPKTQD